MTITIEVSTCKDCPFYNCSGRYGFCKKMHESDDGAYRSGFYVEYTSDIDFLFKNCPFAPKVDKTMAEKMEVLSRYLGRKPTRAEIAFYITSKKNRE